MEPARRKATYEDLLLVPPTMVGEIIDGDLYTTPRPAVRHATAASGIARSLLPAFHGGGGGGGWWILFEPEIHLGADVLVPDMAGWRAERMSRLPDAPFLAIAPDWACEVVSPSTGSIDRVRKMRIYGREQVQHLWLVDPAERTLEVYRSQSDHWVVAATYSGDELVRPEPFGSVEIDLSTWWM